MSLFEKVASLEKYIEEMEGELKQQDKLEEENKKLKECIDWVIEEYVSTQDSPTVRCEQMYSQHALGPEFRLSPVKRLG